jgi:nicotinamide mononucleotide transporter
VLEKILAQLTASSPLEIAAMLLGIGYAVLAVRRNRLCWLAGGASSALLAYLAAGRALPMQTGLQIYYVGLACYGFWHWGRQQRATELPISTWPWQKHVAVCVVLLLLSIATASWLAQETRAAWPFLDSLTTWFSLFAAWLVARVRLENWLYWIVIDVFLVFLFARQGLYFVALLYAIYSLIAVVGFTTWLRKYRHSIQAR